MMPSVSPKSGLASIALTALTCSSDHVRKDKLQHRGRTKNPRARWSSSRKARRSTGRRMGGPLAPLSRATQVGHLFQPRLNILKPLAQIDRRGTCCSTEYSWRLTLGQWVALEAHPRRRQPGIKPTPVPNMLSRNGRNKPLIPERAGRVLSRKRAPHCNGDLRPPRYWHLAPAGGCLRSNSRPEAMPQHELQKAAATRKAMTTL